MTAPSFSALIQAAVLNTGFFPPASRYFGIPTATLTGPDGRTIIYLRRRMVPAPERFATIQEHVVATGERLDNIAAHYLGDPLAFWRIADANRALDPHDLVEPSGRRLLITLPDGMAGARPE